VKAKLRVLDDAQVVLEPEDFSLACNTQAWPSNIEAARVRNETSMTNATQLQEMQESFLNDLKRYAKEVEGYQALGDIADCEAHYDSVRQLQQKLEDAKALSELINSREALFGWPLTHYEQVKKLCKAFAPFASLWTIGSDWLTQYPVWMEGSFVEVSKTEVEENTHAWSLQLKKLLLQFREKDLPEPQRAAEAFLAKLTSFQALVPLIVQLRNP
ncbi:hypothetical protein T492DRAFT_868254, partial [Pavlovales sp. CCMP2436]